MEHTQEDLYKRIVKLENIIISDNYNKCDTIDKLRRDISFVTE